MNDVRSAGGARTLPQRFYLSEEVFALETERVFETHWQCVGRSADVATHGQSALITVEGESLILVRGGDGRLRCFYNVCRHRGTRLCEQDGQRFGKAITCPYHAWSYDLTGACLAAPNMSDVEGFEKTDWPLLEAHTMEAQGFVFVSLSPERPTHCPLGPLAQRLNDWNCSELIAAARLDYVVRANWKMLFQNYNECYHCPRVHPALNAISAYDTAENDLHDGPVLGGPMGLADGVLSMTTTGAACAPRLPALLPEDERRVYYFTTFPTLLISPHPDFVLTHRLRRVSAGETEIVCEFLFHPDAVGSRGFDAGPAVEFWDTTNRQDWHVCELSQQGVASRAYRPGPYSNLECTLAAFDRYYLEVMQMDSK